MAKLTLNDVGTFLDATTAKTTVNGNSAAIETAFENTLSRDGTVPNTMGAELDMNDHQIVNLPSPMTDRSPLRLEDLNEFVGGGTITNIPSGGGTGDVLAKNSASNFDVEWEDLGTILTSGGATTGTGDIVLENGPTINSPSLTGTVSVNGSIIDTNGHIQTPVLKLAGATSGTTSLTPATNATGNLNVPSPAVSDTLVGRDTTDTLTNKTLTAPVMTTPTLGVATATSINKVTITAPATGSTLTIPDGVVLTGPAASGTAMTLGNTETITGVKTFGSSGAVGRLKVAGTTSGTITLDAAAVAGTNTLTLPAATDTLVGKATTDTLTNKTLTSPSLASPTITGTASGSGTLPNIMLVTTPIARVTKQVFTATGTYTPTSGMSYCIIEIVGSGAGGGSAAGTAGQLYAGAGGGSGSYARKYATAADVGASQAVTIGAAGAGGAAGSNAGGAGGDCSVGTLCVGKGGVGGGFSSAVAFGVGGGGGGFGTGDFTTSGTPGICGVFNAVNTTIALGSGAGGSTMFGGGAVGNGGGNGANATGYGGGGAGGLANGAVNVAGGNGMTGIVIITEFCTS